MCSTICLKRKKQTNIVVNHNRKQKAAPLCSLSELRGSALFVPSALPACHASRGKVAKKKEKKKKLL